MPFMNCEKRTCTFSSVHYVIRRVKQTLEGLAHNNFTSGFCCCAKCRIASILLAPCHLLNSSSEITRPPSFITSIEIRISEKLLAQTLAGTPLHVLCKIRYTMAPSFTTVPAQSNTTSSIPNLSRSGLLQETLRGCACCMSILTNELSFLE